MFGQVHLLETGRDGYHDLSPALTKGLVHFDLSGSAFGRMAVSGRSGKLRNRGKISVIYRKTPCKYPGQNIAFHVNAGSTAYWPSPLFLVNLRMEMARSNKWLTMTASMGANWCIIGGPLEGPFSVKLTTLSKRRTLSARDVIPSKWSPKATYTSRLNFLK
ncbi:hypothetical protein HAX54_036465 [Datura stramonium]|uniref:Uncharacterized protein n=1 Tax=Datura stramonium TaxID=4076 RepID=A0ABS8VJN8_DATST|nr:hypothetical protein [Datura stramonium]